MASRDEKLLEVLRGLAPPKAAPGEESGDAPRPAAAPGRPPASAVPGTADREAEPRRARWRIELSLEEVGVFFFAAAALVVLAFLMGWYGRGLAPPGGGDGPVAPERVPLISLDSRTSRDLGTIPPGASRGSARRETYTLLVARFPTGDGNRAEAERRFLMSRGYSKAFLRATREGIELCVGEFASPADPTLRNWLRSVPILKPAYAGCRVVRIPADTANGGADRR